MQFFANVLMLFGAVVGLAHNTVGDIIAGTAMFCFGVFLYVAAVSGPLRR